MSGIISLIVAALLGYWGYHKRLFPAWAFIFNVLVAVYLGLMLSPVILEAQSAGGLLNFLGPYVNVVIMLIITALYFFIAQLLSLHFLTNTYSVSFPLWVDNLGGLVLGFIGGFIIANFLLFAINISPIKNIKFVSKYVPDNSGRTIVHSCQFVSSLSLQLGDLAIAKAYEIITRPLITEPKKKETPKPAAPSANQMPQHPKVNPPPKQSEPNKPFEKPQVNQISKQTEPNLLPEPNEQLNSPQTAESKQTIRLRNLQSPQERRFRR